MAPVSPPCRVGYQWLWSVIVSVTALGSQDGPAVAARGVVRYLEGHVQAGPGQRARFDPERAVGALPIGIGGYYADSLEAPGRWIGSGLGALRRDGPVAPTDLESLLAGINPDTAQALVAARGSSARAAATRAASSVARHGPPDELLRATWRSCSGRTRRMSVASPNAIPTGKRRLSRRRRTVTLDRRCWPGNAPVVDGGFGEATSKRSLRPVTRPPHRRLRRHVFRTEKRFPGVGHHRQPSHARRSHRRARQRRAGRDRLSRNERGVGPDRAHPHPNRRPARCRLPARNLEPQLHTHVVIANAAVHPNATLRALDARGLYLHATTASHLAAAELRHQLSVRLGVQWTPVESGLAEIIGVPDDAIRSFSSRSVEIDILAAELGSNSPAACQVSAYQTRAPKRHSVDLDALQHRWNTRTAETGLTPKHINRAITGPDRPTPPPFTPHDTGRLFAMLSGPDGVTKHRAVFDRRDVIQSVAGHTANRLTAEEVINLADAWLTTPGVVRLEAADERHAIRRRDDTLVAARSGKPTYTTTTMLRLENAIVATFETGHNQSAAYVAPRSSTPPSLPPPPSGPISSSWCELCVCGWIGTNARSGWPGPAKRSPSTSPTQR